MLLWFVATAVAAVWYVFRDARFDHRLLIVGALLPDVVDAPFGGARAAHSVTVAVGVLAVVMLATAGRKPIRRTLLGLPIGMMLHLVFDGAFADADVFWWPFTGGFDDAPLPVVERGWWNVPLELAGAAMIWRGWRVFGLADPERRTRFRRTGQLVADVS